MTIRPILMSGPMVRAILDGRKTQTRRVLSPENLRLWTGGLDFSGRMVKPDAEHFSAAMEEASGFRTIEHLLLWEAKAAPFQAPATRTSWMGSLQFAVGDLLWVREAFWQTSRHPFTMPSGAASPQSMNWGSRRHYAADGQPKNTPNRHYPESLKGGAVSAPDPDAIWVKRPSIHMPRAASRLTLRVTDVRVQRLQDISEDDAQAEGVLEAETEDGDILYSGTHWTYPVPDEHLHHYPKDAFTALWDSLNAKRGHGWDTDPWVVAVSFEAIKANVDAVTP